MKKFIHKKFLLEVVITTIFFFSIEMIFRVVEEFTIIDWATFRIFLSCFFISLLLSFFTYFFKKDQTRRRVTALLLLIATIYAWVQAGFNNFLGVYVSFGTSGQIGAVTSYIKEFLLSYKPEYYFIFIPFILYLVYIYQMKKINKEEIDKIGVKPRIFAFFVLILTGGLYIATLYIPFMQNPIQMALNKHLFFSPTNSSVAINQFGTSVFGVLDIKQQFWPVYIIEESFEKPEGNEEDTRVFDDTIWEEITREETDTTLKTLDRYFLSRPIEQPNDYTGYFKGKNVIVIMMESVNNIILNAEYYPNFQRILEHAWYWENNYSPRNACATGDNEFSGMTSIYALNSACTANVYPNNEYFTSIFNRFKNSGYTVTSYHNLDSTY